MRIYLFRNKFTHVGLGIRSSSFLAAERLLGTKKADWELVGINQKERPAIAARA